MNVSVTGERRSVVDVDFSVVLESVIAVVVLIIVECMLAVVLSIV